MHEDLDNWEPAGMPWGFVWFCLGAAGVLAAWMVVCL